MMYLYIFVLYLSSTTQFFLKQHNKNSYLCNSAPVIGQSVLTECGYNKATDFEFAKNSDGFGLLSPVNSSRTLDIQKKSLQVIFHKKHNRKSQQFQLVYAAPDRFSIINEDKCITRKDSSEYFMEPCNYSDDQQFVLIHNEKEKQNRILPREFFPFRSFGGLFSSNNNILNRIGRLMKNNKTLSKYLSRNHKDHHGHSPDPILEANTDISPTSTTSLRNTPQSIDNLSSTSPNVLDNTSQVNTDNLTGESQDPSTNPAVLEKNLLTGRGQTSDRTIPEDTVDHLARHSNHTNHHGGHNSHGGHSSHGSHSSRGGHNSHGGHSSHDGHSSRGGHSSHGLLSSNLHGEYHGHDTHVRSHRRHHHGSFNRHNQHHHNENHAHEHEHGHNHHNPHHHDKNHSHEDNEHIHFF